MPISTRPGSSTMKMQLHTIEMSLKNFQFTRLLRLAEFKEMYNLMEQHNRDFSLAHLTGKPKDIMVQAEQDTKFYFILMKMLNEVACQKLSEQAEGVLQVYNWFLNNKHTLHTGPRFGLGKVPTKQNVPSVSTSITVPNSDLIDIMDEENRPPVLGSTENLLASTTNSTDNSDSEEENKLTMHKFSGLQEDVSSRSTSAKLPKKKVVPLTHIHNPLSQYFREFDERKEQENAQKITSERGAKKAKTANEKSNLQKWEEYKMKFNTQQEELGDWQHMGRIGTPGTTRYSCHDNGLKGERYTPDVLRGYVQALQPASIPRPDTPSMLVNATLEDFYELSQRYSPSPITVPERPKTPSTPHLLGAVFNPLQTEISDQYQSGILSEKKSESAIQVNTMMNMIDTITEEMLVYKEKIADDPYPGFRQPVLDVDKSKVPFRPGTAPPMFRTQAEQKRESTLVNPPTDWRGCVTAEKVVKIDLPSVNLASRSPPRPVSKTGRPQSGRPRTAPMGGRAKSMTGKEEVENMRVSAQAANNTMTEIDKKEYMNLFQIQHINSKRQKKQQTQDFRDEYFEFLESLNYFDRTADVNPSDKEFVSFCKSVDSKKSGNEALLKRSSAPPPTVRDPVVQFQCPPDGKPVKVPYRPDQQSADTDAENSRIEVEQTLREVHDLITEVNDLVGSQTSTHHDAIPEEPPRPASGPARLSGRNVEDDDPEPERQLFSASPHRFTHKRPGAKKSIMKQAPPPFSVKGLSLDGSESDVTSARGLVNPHTAPMYSNDVTVAKNQTGDLMNQSQRLASAYKNRHYQRTELKREGGVNSGKRSSRELIIDQPRSSRTAGTVPLRAKSNSPQKMVAKQRDMMRNAPVTPRRSTPSIPRSGTSNIARERSPWSGHIYMSEVEAHARKMDSPRSYVQKVVGMRSQPAVDLSIDGSPIKTRPSGFNPNMRAYQLNRDLNNDTPASVYRGHHGTPISREDDQDQVDLASLQGRPSSNLGGLGLGGMPFRPTSGGSGPPRRPPSGAGGLHQRPASSTSRVSQHTRPIPAYVDVQDPDHYAEAMQARKAAAAAVQIQSLFRGFLVRRDYSYLTRDARERRENERMASIRIQRNYRKHLGRKRAIYNRKSNKDEKNWNKEYDSQLNDRGHERDVKAKITSYNHSENHAKSQSRISQIGPHVEVYQSFHPKKTGIKKSLLNSAALVLQKWTRGWLIRQRMKEIKRKAKWHASSWTKFISQYKEVLIRVQSRFGVQRPKTGFNFQHVNEFMDNKKRYESVFEQRAFGGEMELDELVGYLNKCDLYPSQGELADAMQTVFRGKPKRKNTALFKHEVLDITYQICPPGGTGIENTIKSTWLKPIVDGRDGTLIRGHSDIEKTNFEACWNLVVDRKKEDQEQSPVEPQHQSEQQCDNATKKVKEGESNRNFTHGGVPESSVSDVTGSLEEVD